jgi:hypothetical protein
MTWEEWVKLIQSQYPTEGSIYPNEWQYARSLRENNPDPQLANAEHYLWGMKEAQANPFMGLFGPMLAAGYYGGKKTGLLGGRSPATLDQLLAGSKGYLAGIWD